MYPHWVSRTLCLASARVGCSTCPDFDFKMTFQANIGDQAVACPRWDSEATRLQGVPVQEYVVIKREPCLTVRPFPWCSSCANSRPEEPPRANPGWYDQERRVKKPLPLLPEVEEDETA